MGKNRLLIPIVLVLAMTGFCLSLAGSQHLGDYRLMMREDFHRRLMDELSMECMIPRGGDAVSRKEETIIYVLGSTQERLKYHFQTAAGLYEEGVAERILFLSRPGFTEYSPELLRNLTNDEWSVRELESLGVPEGKVEAVPVPMGFFGTYSEAKRIPRFARARRYKRLVLVMSPHHARRAYLTFSHFLGGGIDLYVCGSSDSVNLAALLVEYGKYLWYRWVLLPVTSSSLHARALLNLANRVPSKGGSGVRFRSGLEGRKGLDTVWIL